MEAPCVLQMAQHLGPLFARVAQGHQRIHGFAGLRNGHHERTRGQNRVTVTEFVREFDFHGIRTQCSMAYLATWPA